MSGVAPLVAVGAASLVHMTRNAQQNNRPPEGLKWPAKGSISVMVESAGETFWLDDLSTVDPWHHFWTPLGMRVTVNGNPSEYIPQLAYLFGTVDSTRWSATVESGLIKTKPGTYEATWTHITSIEVGLYAGVRAESADLMRRARAWTAQMDHSHTEHIDIEPLIARATYAVKGALVALQEARTYVAAVRADAAVDPHLRGLPHTETKHLPIEGQVAVIARLYKLAVDYGYNDPQTKVIQATGMSETTVKRRLKAAGIKKRKGTR